MDIGGIWNGGSEYIDRRKAEEAGMSEWIRVEEEWTNLDKIYKVFVKEWDGYWKVVYLDEDGMWDMADRSFENREEAVEYMNVVMRSRI